MKDLEVCYIDFCSLHNVGGRPARTKAQVAAVLDAAAVKPEEAGDRFWLSLAADWCVGRRDDMPFPAQNDARNGAYVKLCGDRKVDLAPLIASDEDYHGVSTGKYKQILDKKTKPKS